MVETGIPDIREGMLQGEKQEYFNFQNRHLRVHLILAAIHDARFIGNLTDQYKQVVNLYQEPFSAATTEQHVGNYEEWLRIRERDRNNKNIPPELKEYNLFMNEPLISLKYDTDQVYKFLNNELTAEEKNRIKDENGKGPTEETLKKLLYWLELRLRCIMEENNFFGRRTQWQRKKKPQI